jgi:hypothetical protein
LVYSLATVRSPPRVETQTRSFMPLAQAAVELREGLE